ncbi:hypothetical protein [Microbacterium marinilacus]|uniref:Uncharacterized protein n=1 Tax=Microbacterium marinilacus TaxID=415209 RepID=A0ABP7B865_9MICO|nr:hypothetical protein [Microbacterium marinilacus]MBY0687549.1 hypothetical protein [Microbacterium marinilacus]
MGFWAEDAPWGSPVDPTIPLPPFEDEGAHAAYARKLQLHLALVDGGAPSLSTVALSLALERPRRRPDDRDTQWLTPLELSVSLTSWFPAPWTPDALARSLRPRSGAPTRGSAGEWRWLDDPDFLAAPDGGAGWRIVRSERGTRTPEGLVDDRDLVVLWMAHFRGKFAFPLGHGRDADEVRRLAVASAAVVEADEKDAAYPYRSSWRDERDAALTEARR